MDTRIYVMTHKKIAQIPDKTYISLHVGRAGKEDFGYQGDHTGENISDKNGSFCELTGMYWLWKNVKCDIIGICHYRRYFIRDEKILDKVYIERTIRKYPMIIPNSRCVEEGEDVYRHYAKRHYAKDLDLCREVIAEKYPQYLSAFDYSMNSILISLGNMWITKKDIYDRYCSWLFDILFEVEKRIDVTGYDDYQKRVMGFLSERLFRVWLFMQNEAITEEEVKQIEPSDFHNREKQIELLHKYTKLKIAPVLQLHQSGKTQRTLAAPFTCKDNFEGKIPVWVCWWQGQSNMPELVRVCYGSLRKNLPEEKVSLRLITLENCMEYVTFTETIIRKFNEEKITHTHLSDILRAELLYRYGGMWIDAAYYTAAPIPKEFFEQRSIYTLRFKDDIKSSDAARGRWSSDLWYTNKEHKLFQILMESLWYYWEAEDSLIEEAFSDYIIAAAVEKFPEIKAELERCGFASGQVYELQSWINRKYTEERMQRIKADRIFYKLDCGAYYQKENLAGEKTLYGHLLEE